MSLASDKKLAEDLLGTSVNMLHARDREIKSLKSQRDELLAALEKIVSEGDYTAPEGMKRIARAAIAKATLSTERSAPL